MKQIFEIKRRPKGVRSNKQKLWRLEARLRNIEKERKHCGRIFKDGPKTSMRGFVYPLLDALFNNASILKGASVV